MSGVDRMDVLAHWLGHWDRSTGGPSVSPMVLFTPKQAEEARDIGYRVEGPFVLDNAGAVEALREICRRGNGQRAPLEWVALPAVDALKALGIDPPGGQ